MPTPADHTPGPAVAPPDRVPATKVYEGPPSDTRPAQTRNAGGDDGPGSPRGGGAADPPPQRAEPNYALIAIGLLVLTASLAFAPGIEAMQQMLVTMLGMTITLFGLYPLPAQVGTVGWLKIAGPGALFIFLAAFAAKEIKDQQRARRAEIARLLVLQVSQSPGLNQEVLPDGSRVRVLNVHSFDDQALVGVMAEMRTTIEQALGNTVPARVDSIHRITFRRMVRTLNFVRPDSAEALYDAAMRDPRGVDERWAALVKAEGALLGENSFGRRVNSLPYAFVAIEKDNLVRVEPVVPGHQVAVGGGVYTVPVIANPRLKDIGNSLEEAIVLQRTGPTDAQGRRDRENLAQRLLRGRTGGEPAQAGTAHPGPGRTALLPSR